MNQWLTGNTGVKKLSLLNEKFESACVSRINSELSKNYKEYTPFMSLEHKRNLLPDFLLQKQSLLIKDNNLLKALSDFYTPPANKKIDGKNTVTFCFDEKQYPVYNSAIKLFINSNSFVVDTYHSIIKNIIPMKTIEGQVRIEGVGNSNHESIGAIYLSIPSIHPSKLQLAINIAHETGHQALMLYQTSDSIIIPSDLSKNVFSAVRKTERPAIQSFHALTALVYMYDFITNINTNQLTEEEKTFAKKQQINYANSLKNNIYEYKKIKFTTIGKMIYDEIIDYVENI